jgi:hypothetical protein
MILIGLASIGRRPKHYETGLTGGSRDPLMRTNGKSVTKVIAAANILRFTDKEQGVMIKTCWTASGIS